MIPQSLIPQSLENKITNHQVIFNQHFIIELNREEYEYCEQWIEDIIEMTRTSSIQYKIQYKIDIGRFRGVWPCKIDKDEVEFLFDYYTSISEALTLFPDFISEDEMYIL